MKKVKDWFKKHKKEIIVGAAAIGGAALYFLIKNKATVRGSLSFSIYFDEDIAPGKYFDANHCSITLNDPDLGVSDLGKLGEIIAEMLPLVKTDNARISSVMANYSTCNKKR